MSVVPSAAMTAIVKREGNGLALLANKCAARTFDISSGMVYASIRDQIVRAQLLIRDLKETDARCTRVLIVGAGVAGVTAATCASEFGIEAVVLDTQSGPFGLQVGVSSRKVGPFMYEWPSATSAGHSYPSVSAGIGKAFGGTPSWSASNPISAERLASELTAWLNAQVYTKAAPEFVYNYPAVNARAYVDSFVKSFAGVAAGGTLAAMAPPFVVPGRSAKRGPFQPDYVILAVGMGRERVHLIDGDKNGPQGVPFWCDDDLRHPARAREQIGIFGGGDGALQDVLRVLTRHDHPLAFVDALSVDSDVKALLDEARPELEAMEHQSQRLATWSESQVYDLIDAACQKLCGRLGRQRKVSEAVLQQLRPGSGVVHHVFKGKRFGRAYLLNRFCVHLIAAVQGKSAGRVTYERRAGRKAVAYSPSRTAWVPGQGADVTLDDGSLLKLDRIVVRFGVDVDELEKLQLIRLNRHTHPDRTSMAAIPLPLVVAR